MSQDAHVQVVRGTPDDVELAALVAGLLATAAAADPGDAPTPTAAWSDRSRRLAGSSSAPGATTWRWSLHP